MRHARRRVVLDRSGRRAARPRPAGAIDAMRARRRQRTAGAVPVEWTEDNGGRVTREGGIHGRGERSPWTGVESVGTNGVNYGIAALSAR